MFIFFILGILIGGVAVIFSLQNTALITVSFFSWQVESSLAAILSLTLLTGMVVAFFLFLPELIGGYIKRHALKKENKELHKELQKQKELLMFAKKEAPNDEVISEIEHGAIAH